MSKHLTRGKAYQTGFTMIELVTVMVIVGIMGAAIIPRFFERNSFDSRGFYDQVISTLRYAQKTAIAQRRLVCVTFPTTSRIVLKTTSNFADVNCTTNPVDLKDPSGSGQAVYAIDAPNGVVLAGAADFNFTPLGRTNIAVAQITVGGGYTINIDQETGYVR